MSLPKFPTTDNTLSLLQTKWAEQIDPVVAQPFNSGVILSNVILSSSSVINHKLGRDLQGWALVRLRGKATVFDTQDVNPIPSKTLQLNASSGVSADILVF